MIEIGDIETDRTAAISAFERIARLVEYDSAIYHIAAEHHAMLVHSGRQREARDS